jgi:16S rRNA U516 pseudouridylate synthase RsuA-like enzyme
LPVRLNRYLASAGLGTRREVEGLIRLGRVTVAGERADDPARRVEAGEAVALDGTPVVAPPRAAVLLYKPRGADAVIVHPPGLHVVMPLKRIERGAELLLGDEDLARRVADPRHPQEQLRDGRFRQAYAGLDVGDLAPGEWRPLGHKEIERLRRSVRLPPR